MSKKLRSTTSDSFTENRRLSIEQVATWFSCYDSQLDMGEPMLVQSSKVLTDFNPVSDFSSLNLNRELVFCNISTNRFDHAHCRRFEELSCKEMGWNIRRQFNTIQKLPFVLSIDWHAAIEQTSDQSCIHYQQCSNKSNYR